MNSPLEIIDMQNELIKEQADSITDLLKILMQYIEMDEIEKSPIKEKIDHAAQIRMELGG